MQDIDALLNNFSKGDIRSLSKLISIIENDGEITDYIFSRIFHRISDSYRIGVTGPPGAGKSTIVDILATRFKGEGNNVSIIAVDPTSPFTGGALLGDRIRMKKATEEGIYIRSLASRGSLGGLSSATAPIADLLDAFGYGVIFIETIGVGQSELDVMNTADTVLVVLVPESGDSIQTMKAGLVEIADIFVINKSDRPGADRLEMDLNYVLSLSGDDKVWPPPVIKTIATQEVGFDELFQVIAQHKRYLENKGLKEEKRRKRVKNLLQETIKERLFTEFSEEKHLQENLLRWVESIIKGEDTPYSIIEGLFE